VNLEKKSKCPALGNGVSMKTHFYIIAEDLDHFHDKKIFVKIFAKQNYSPNLSQNWTFGQSKSMKMTACYNKKLLWKPW